VNMRVTAWLVVLLALPLAHAQSPPALTRTINPPHLSGRFSYTLHYSQNAEFGSSLGDWQTSSASGAADFANSSTRLPFSLNYGGGYTWTLAGPGYATGLFQHLFLSQGLVWEKWNVDVSDDVSYRPQAPTTGFSGIPGIGEPIGVASPAPPSDQSVLTVNTHVVNNEVIGDLSRRLNYAYTASAGGSSYLLRYPDGNGIDTDAYTGNGALKWRLNARDSLSAKYTFSQFSYPENAFNFTTNTVLPEFTRIWNRKVSSDVAAGPEFTGSSDSALVPSAIRIAARASVTCSFRSASAVLTYSRATQGGGGYYIGAEGDRVTATLSREYGRNLSLGFNVSYMLTTGLENNGTTSSTYGGAQMTRRLGPRFTIFANYTATNQSTTSSLPSNTLHGLMQMASVGIGYGSRERQIGH